MVLNEEQNEHNQRMWLSRAARERQGLSFSIEKTLEEAQPPDELWWVEEENDHTNMPCSVHEKSLFPPRLSLQSRVLATVELPQDCGSTSHSADDDPACRMAEEGDLATAGPNTNVLMRFAQRLTSSFNTLNALSDATSGMTKGAENDERNDTADSSLSGKAPQVSAERVQPVHVGNKASSLAAIADVEVCTASTAEALSMKEGQLEEASVPRTNSKALQARQGRQRLAGRNTRVRLEVVSGAHSPGAKVRPKASEDKAVQKRSQEQDIRNCSIDTGSYFPVEQTWFEESGMTSASLPVIRSHPQRDEETIHDPLSALPTDLLEKKVPGADISVASFPLQEEKDTGEHIPLAGASSRETPYAPDSLDASVSYQGMVGSTTQGTLSGSGAFECGQSEATIMNSYVTATSVILVMLTSNPGPVVVQYITLQPQTGFTVHLTAPTAMRTTFNYIVLLGELF